MYGLARCRCWVVRTSPWGFELLTLLAEDGGRSPWECFVFERVVRIEVAFSLIDLARLCEFGLGDEVGAGSAGDSGPSPWFGILDTKTRNLETTFYHKTDLPTCDGMMALLKLFVGLTWEYTVSNPIQTLISRATLDHHAWPLFLSPARRRYLSRQYSQRHLAADCRI